MNSAADTYQPLLNPFGGFLVTSQGEAAPLPRRNFLEETVFQIKIRLRSIASASCIF